jgi:hypothetical protein
MNQTNPDPRRLTMGRTLQEIFDSLPTRRKESIETRAREIMARMEKDTGPGIWNYGTLGNPGLTTDPVRWLPLPQFDYGEPESD